MAKPERKTSLGKEDDCHEPENTHRLPGMPSQNT